MTKKILDGKVAAVTGAGQGNGKAIALRLAREGASIFASDLDKNLLDQLKDELTKMGSSVEVGVFDASKVSDAKEFISTTVAKFGRIDILVNNAGAIRAQPFLEVTEETWDWTIDLNMKGLFFYMQEGAKVMVKQGSGTIINIASVAGIQAGVTLSPPYAASKAGVINVTKAAGAFLAKKGVTVNAVAPGIVDTSFNWTLDREVGVKQMGKQEGEFLQERADLVPMGRLSVPDDVANVVYFLSTPDANYMTGETLVVSGGLAMR